MVQIKCILVKELARSFSLGQEIGVMHELAIVDFSHGERCIFICNDLTGGKFQKGSQSI